MNKLFVFVVLLIALAMGGCMTTRDPDGSTRHYVMLQVGVYVRVKNECQKTLMDIERVGGVMVHNLHYGESIVIPMHSTPFSGNYRRMPLTANILDMKRNYLMSVTEEFKVNTRRGSYEGVWAIGCNGTNYQFSH